jgi:acyl-CoA synthetase (NDP forming)
MTDTDRARLRLALNPRSVAVVGASDNPDKIGGRPLLYLSKFGYKGKVYPINPNRRKVQGFKAVPSVSELTEAPDAAVIAVPGELAVAAVQECAKLGVKVAVVMTSGFGEVSSPEGKAQQLKMVEAARGAGMRLIGPNTQGLANFGTGAILSFSTMYIEAPARDGPVGIVSQSGAMSVVPYGLLRSRGIGVRHSHATGNDADVSVAELAAVVAEDLELKLLLLYLETVRDPVALAEMARVARERGLPVVALKSGRTQAGQQAAQSHTGALANEDRVVDAFLRQHGIWRARDTQEMVRATELYLKGWKPDGKRLVAISNSGAVCVMAADAATDAGMPMAQLSGETRAALARILPGFATTTNPVDITAALLSNSALFGQILPVIAKDPAADAFLIGIPVAGQGYDVEAFASDSAVFARRTGKPVVMAVPQPSVAEKFKAQGLPVFPTEAEAIAALDQYIGHLSLMSASLGADIPLRYSRPPKAARTLSEADSLEFVSRYGVPVVSHRLCRSRDEAFEALAALGGPVAVKACSPDMPHKSEWGVVRLNLRTEEEVRSAYDDFDKTLRIAGARYEGAIVARMVKARRELMVGGHWDAVFGPVVMVGDGGKYVEALPDAQILLPPFSYLDVERALQRLRIWPLFAGVRGEPPMDVQAVCDLVVKVGHLMANAGLGVVSLDLNPVMVLDDGEGCVVVDGVVYLE